MINCQKVACMFLTALHFVGCADIATPVTVLPPEPEHEGSEPTKTGVAFARKFLGLIPYGDSRIREAKRNGGIKDVAMAEVLKKSILFDVYQRQCTEASGYAS